ncbi:MAG: hypothetical protein HC811_06515 [Flammeovirgaceae bacterium]|nr:hypothetical protein [Flammeovirgaceae bacterium]
MNDSAKKKVIHEYLTQGKRQDALIYVQEAYGVSYLEAQRLLTAIEAEGQYPPSAFPINHSLLPSDVAVEDA